MTYVETVYDPSHFRKPDVSGYETKTEAEMMVRTTLKWGMGIVSCKIVPKPKKVKK